MISEEKKSIKEEKKYSLAYLSEMKLDEVTVSVLATINLLEEFKKEVVSDMECFGNYSQTYLDNIDTEIQNSKNTIERLSKFKKD